MINDGYRYFDEHIDELKGKKILMYCTGKRRNSNSNSNNCKKRKYNLNRLYDDVIHNSIFFIAIFISFLLFVFSVCAFYSQGGVRCERASAYLKYKGIDDVYHLKGGIHAYQTKYGGLKDSRHNYVDNEDKSNTNHIIAETENNGVDKCYFKGNYRLRSACVKTILILLEYFLYCCVLLSV